MLRGPGRPRARRLARSLALATPPLSGALTALGRPSRSILVNLVTSFALFPLLPLLLLAVGVNGAGGYALVQAIVAVTCLAAMFRQTTLGARPAT